MRLFFSILVLWVVFSLQELRAQAAPILEEQLATLVANVDAHRESLIDFRRDLHKNPEVSGQEKRTSRKVSKRLEALGLDVRTNIGGYGVVALLEGGQPGPIVAFRADMDAVYSDAPDPVEFASRVPGVRHICGHDIHTTLGIALAEGFASIQEDLAGSVLFIFQPAEERVEGARAMIDEGALQNPTPDAIYSVHTSPLETGQVASRPGVMMARRGNLVIKLQGEEDLSGSARTVKEAIEGLSTLPANAMSAEGDFILARVFRSESAKKAREWSIRASITTTFKDLNTQINDKLSPVLNELESQGISAQMEYVNSSAAGVTNDPVLEQRSRALLNAVLGEDSHVELTTVPTPFSEDFGLFQEEVPGVMYFLGVSNREKGWIGMPHSPVFVADEESIFVGTKAMAAVMLDFLNLNQGGLADPE